MFHRSQRRRAGRGRGIISVLSRWGILVLFATVLATVFVKSPKVGPVGKDANTSHEGVNMVEVGQREPNQSSAHPVLPSAVVLPRQGQHPTLIRGEVWSMDGSRVEGAHVSLMGVDGESYGQRLPVNEMWSPTATDGDGNFVLAGVPYGEYAVLARSGSMSAIKSVRLTEIRSTAAVQMILRLGQQVAGLIVDEGGKPIPGARVVPLDHDGENLWAHERSALSVRTGEDGQFTLFSLEPRTCKLYVLASGYAPRVAGPFTVGTFDARILLSEGKAIVGEVVNADTAEPLGQVCVLAKDETLPVEPLLTHSDERGQFVFPALAFSRYRIDVDSPPLVLVGGPKLVEVTAGEGGPNIRLRAKPGGGVNGRVIDGETREGVPKVVIAARPVDGRDRRIKSKPTDADGRFEIAGLGEGIYKLSPWTSRQDTRLERMLRRKFVCPLGRFWTASKSRWKAVSTCPVLSWILTEIRRLGRRCAVLATGGKIR